MTRVSQMTRVCMEIIASQERATELGNGDIDPKYRRRNAIWRGIDNKMSVLIETAAVTLADCQAKVLVCIAIPSDDLYASLFRDVLALV